MANKVYLSGKTKYIRHKIDDFLCIGCAFNQEICMKPVDFPHCTVYNEFETGKRNYIFKIKK